MSNLLLLYKLANIQLPETEKLLTKNAIGSFFTKMPKVSKWGLIGTGVGLGSLGLARLAGWKPSQETINTATMAGALGMMY
ncbi:MAG: hypothetical protein ABIM30_00625 [candidate division WOR-3 bacterium]